MSDRYRATIIGQGQDHTDPLSQTARIILYERNPHSDHLSYLNNSGLWVTIKEGEQATDVGIVVPSNEAIDAIGLAIEAFQGKTNHGATEVKVLREWLAVEQRRVDALVLDAIKALIPGAVAP